MWDQGVAAAVRYGLVPDRYLVRPTRRNCPNSGVSLNRAIAVAEVAGPSAARNELPLVLLGCCADERVTDGAARDAQTGKIPAQLDRLVLAQEDRFREVTSQDADDIGGRTTEWTGQTCRTLPDGDEPFARRHIREAGGALTAEFFDLAASSDELQSSDRA